MSGTATPPALLPAYPEDLEKSRLSGATITETDPVTATASLPALYPAHLEYLEARGISRATTEGNALRSARPQDLARLGGRRVPDGTSGLEIPYAECDGFSRVRYFPPILDCDGHEQKFGQPAGSPVRLYVPAGVRPILDNPEQTISIVEGEIKALALTQAGFPGVGLGGVWCFRSRDLPDDAMIADLEAVTWRGRAVRLVPDSDCWTNGHVRQAVYRFTRLLQARGATVRVVVIPPGPEGAKQGADDYLVSTGAAGFQGLVDGAISINHDAFRRLRELEGVTAGHAEPTGGHPYRIQDGRLCRVRQTKEGPITEPLANFTATVAEEIIQDDGAEATRAFIIGGVLDSGQPLPSVRVAAAQFAGMSWVTAQWGLRAVVRAGQSTRDYLREAIQRLSPNAPQKHVFTHTGWRDIGGEWVYLSGGGVVGRDGFEVELGPELSRYRLPRHAEDPVGAMRASLRLLTLGPLTVTAPLWAGTFRAPLASLLPLDLALWLEGQTGNLKSTLAAVFLSHYGDFDRTHLPGAWASTANQLERRAFVLKDAMFVVDDYAPSLLDARELELKAARLLRAQGNLAGRGRLRSDLTEHPAYPPRGLIVATGEQHPPGQSVLARLLLVEPRRGDIDLGRLNEAQRTVGRLPHALAGYVAWLAPQLESLVPLLRETFSGARARVQSGGHLRVPEALVHLWVGVAAGLDYAEDIGACSGDEAEALRTRCWDALTALGSAQAGLVAEERPSLRFLRAVHALVSQGRGLLLPRDDGAPDHRAGVDFLGWQDEAGLYLLPEPVYAAVSRFCRDAGEPFPVRRERLQKDLTLEGLAEAEERRNTKTARLGGRTRRVLWLKRRAVADLLGEDFPCPSPVVTDITGSEE